MNVFRYLLMLTWVFLSGGVFIYLLFGGAGSAAWISKNLLLLGIIFYAVTVPTLVFMEANQPVSSVRYKSTLALSIVGSLLAYMLFIDGFDPSLFGRFLNPFFVPYLLMGSWALCTVWFLLVCMKYKQAGKMSKIYAYVSTASVNIGLLIVLAVWSDW